MSSRNTIGKEKESHTTMHASRSIIKKQVLLHNDLNRTIRYSNIYIQMHMSTKMSSLYPLAEMCDDSDDGDCN